jgi:cell fate (sporulation/competence/biofilm development) regulator YlbF (YheA/YmcA/DUF963 family)
MDIIEKAKELGNMIKESNQMADLKNSEAKMMQDEKARTILNDLYLLQDEMAKAMQEGKDREVLESIQQKFISKQNDMRNYDITKNYLEDKSKFDSLMKQINDVIVYSMTGEEPCSSHDCGSCGGSCGHQ